MANHEALLKDSLPEGFKLGSYRIRKVLGAGGFGITYLAEFTQGTGTELVAIKELFPRTLVYRLDNYSVELAQHSEQEILNYARNSFLREAQALKKLKGHPNIVNVVDLFGYLNTYYLVMEYQPGPSLLKEVSTRFKDGRPFSQFEIEILCERVGSALKLAHSHNIYHRDVSADNIIMTRPDRPVLIDFGAAKQILENHEQTINENSQPVVKDGFSPFELYHCGGKIGPWTDIYSLAATIYFCMTGKKPPSASMRCSGLQKGKDPIKKLISIESVRNNYSKKLIYKIERGLILDPAKRPQSIEKWLGKLKENSKYWQAPADPVKNTQNGGLRYSTPFDHVGRSLDQKDPGVAHIKNALRQFLFLFLGILALLIITLLLSD